MKSIIRLLAQVRTQIALLGVLGVYLVSAFHVASHSLEEVEVTGEKIRTIRIAHSLTDSGVKDAFQDLANRYQRIHTDVRVEIQAIPLRAYEQWITTQLMGGTAPDLVQLLRTAGSWEVLAQHYLVPLTPFISNPNPYNRNNELANDSWRDTYIDGMEGGYFIHVMEFFTAPLTLDNNRIFYNADLFEQALDNASPPRNFRKWMKICRRLVDYSRESGRTFYPLAVSQEDELFSRYYQSLTGGMMDPYDVEQFGNSGFGAVYYGLQSEGFDLKNDRIRAAFDLIKELYTYVQPSFVSDMPAQKRFLFIQEQAAMVVGNTRDLGIYKDIADFEVGVFDFPQAGVDDPKYGQYYEGPSREASLATFAFGLTQNSRHHELVIDFLRFCTSKENNEAFCRSLNWFPAIAGARVSDPDLRNFEPVTEGVSRYPGIDPGNGPINLFFVQNLPLFLDDQIDFDTFMDGFENIYRTGFKENFQHKLDQSLGNRPQTEFNIAKETAKMLFTEAGEVEAGTVVGDRTPYQLALEIGEQHDSYINGNIYVYNKIQTGEYPFPLFQSTSQP
jgi:ABC-type glycerol-3-phosphate transport system substrate-binding protein